LARREKLLSRIGRFNADLTDAPHESYTVMMRNSVSGPGIEFMMNDCGRPVVTALTDSFYESYVQAFEGKNQVELLAHNVVVNNVIV
jgi:hypothetical protein